MFVQTLPLKRFSLVLSGLLATILLLSPLAASAQGVGQLCRGADLSFGPPPGVTPGSDADKPCKVDGGTANAETKVGTIITQIINIISVVVGVTAVIMVIYGGFRFVTSGGNAESTKTARNTILYALIGLVIVAFAQLIVKFVLTKIA